ncbi:MAG: hypothetical protein HOY71_35585, partial [Nonomuraea sp.]|nr:hypothetical protein [Nonomuraea sp.]
REPLRTPLHLPQPRGWAKDGRLLASDGDRYYLLDTTTGRVEEQENRFPRTALVAGRWA